MDTIFAHTLIHKAGDAREGSHTKMYRSMGNSSGRTRIRMTRDSCMESNCRFCRQGQLELLFPRTTQAASVKSQTFSCTNSGFGLHGPIVKCGNCAIIYDNDHLPQKKINSFYRQVDDREYFREQQARQATFIKHLDKLSELKGEKGSLLDIGTNTGLFVYLAKQRGWQARGLDPNKNAVRYARKHYHQEIINKSFQDCPLPENYFDCITMWDVIEHFDDPVEVLTKVAQLLKNGGLFAFTTVNPNSLFARFFGTKWPWYMQMHRVYFSKKATGYYLALIGFKRIIFRPHFRYLSLEYLATRTSAIHPLLALILSKLVNTLHLSKFVVPYFAFDLYDCYAFK